MYVVHMPDYREEKTSALHGQMNLLTLEYAAVVPPLTLINVSLGMGGIGQTFCKKWLGLLEPLVKIGRSCQHLCGNKQDCLDLF